MTREIEIEAEIREQLWIPHTNKQQCGHTYEIQGIPQIARQISEREQILITASKRISEASDNNGYLSDTGRLRRIIDISKHALQEHKE
ncbi:MAG: hypothetical protein V3U75_13410 [Methylococcaceae bacterium]